MDSTEKVDVLGVHVDPMNLRAVLETVEEFIREAGRRTVMYANVHCVSTAWRDEEYRKILNKSDLVYCDGYGIVLGAKILGEYMPERMTGADWIYDLSRLCSERGYSLFLLGGRPGVAEKAGERLRSLYEGIRIKGTHHGYLADEEMANGVIRIVNEARPDILLVGMGSPVQERFVDRYREQINAPVCWVVGALFDFVSGVVPRAPKWMLDNGLEWLFRFLYEPRRMWKRYFIGNLLFLTRVLLYRYRDKVH